MFDFIAQVLALFYELPVVGGSYGIAIILLTIAVVGAVMLSRRDTGEIVDVDSYVREAPIAPKLRRSTASDEAAPGDDAAAEEVDV